MPHQLMCRVRAALGAVLVTAPLASCTLAEGMGKMLNDPSHYGPPPGGGAGGVAQQPDTPTIDIAAAPDEAPSGEPPGEATVTPTAAGEAEPAEAAETIDVEDFERFEAPDGRRLSSLESRRFESGLVVHELRLGDETAAECTADSMIIVHYHGTLADGTVVDTTRGGEPAGPWALDQLVTGWRRGLVGMHVGGIRRLEIPAALGYGDEAVIDPETGEEVIPAGADLIYAIELIEVR